jgi:spore maturation protein A
MLNYIWLALIVIGITVALALDVTDITSDKYRNNKPFSVQVEFDSKIDFNSVDFQDCKVSFTRDYYNQFYNVEKTTNDNLQYTGKIKISENKSKSVIQVDVTDLTPDLWREISKNQSKNATYMAAKIDLSNLKEDDTGLATVMIVDPIKFVKMNKVTNDGVIAYANTAVELAIGLIGIMALWLGIMKIAEEAGLIAMLAKLLKPITTRLFPDVPAQHPAMGAMIMNISANMLGLGNAATPFGIKAMEELKKLSKKPDTATDAMATFLVMNTSNLQLIPATVIAVRAAAGSASATEIIGPVIATTAVSVTVGVTTVKLLAKLPMFKKQLLPDNTINLKEE